MRNLPQHHNFLILCYIFNIGLFCYDIRGSSFFFLWKHFPKEEADARSAVEHLPEECNREVEKCSLKPCRNDIRASIFEQYSCNQTHDRAHNADDHSRNSKCDYKRSVIWCDNTKCKCMSKLVYDKEFQ